MNANQIIDDTMSLEEKLTAIEKAMQNAQIEANEEASKRGRVAVPVDPADLLACEGCQ